MKKNEQELVTEEGFTLKFYPRETENVTLEISTDTLEVLKKKAKERDLSLKALLKLYIGQSLRQDLSQEEAKELALKRFNSRKGAKIINETDLAA